MPKVVEMLPRWRLFPREIESDLHLYHLLDIGDWHSGEMSSRKLLIYLDGLPGDSWYKLSVNEFLEEAREEAEYLHADDVSGLIFAQLSGQEISIE